MDARVPSLVTDGGLQGLRMLTLVFLGTKDCKHCPPTTDVTTARVSHNRRS